MTLKTRKTVSYEIAYAVEGENDRGCITTYNKDDVKFAILTAQLYKKLGSPILITKKTIVCEYAQLLDGVAP